MAAFGEGLASRNIPFVYRNPSVFSEDQFCSDFDVVVTSGVKGKGGEVVSCYRRRGVPSVVVDFGYVNRASGRDNAEEGYWSVGFGGLKWVPKDPCPSDRAEEIGLKFLKYRLPIQPDAPVVICGQVPDDAAHGQDINELRDTYTEIALQIRHQTMRDIWFRPHPEHPGMRPKHITGIDRRPLRKTLRSAHSIVSINSNIGLEAALVGCPVFHMDPSCHYSEVSTLWPEKVENASAAPRAAVKNLLNRLCYAQWTTSEMREAKHLDFLMSIWENEHVGFFDTGEVPEEDGRLIPYSGHWVWGW